MRVVRSARTVLFLTLLALGLGVSSARAATITLDYTFTASGFSDPSVPDPITGSFSLTFDNSTSIVAQTPVSSFTMSAPYVGPVVFTYNQSLDAIFIGGNGDSTGFSVSAGTLPDFYLAFAPASLGTPPTLTAFVYGYLDQAGAFQTADATTTTVDAAPVPEPGSITLLGIGLAGVAGRRWRQRKCHPSAPISPSGH